MNDLIPPPNDLNPEEDGHPQRPSSWNPQAWFRQLPDHREFLEQLPNPISREGVTDFFGEAHVDASTAVHAFLASMVWGYGPVGYGAYRTKRVLGLNLDAGERLRRVVAVARDDGPIPAFRVIARNRLTYLGPAFGTKFLYFATRANRAAHGDRTAPVLDQVVRRWFLLHADVRLDGTWSVANYERYVGLLEHWGDELGISSDHVEEIVFERQVARNSGRTTPPQSPTGVEDDAGDGDPLEALRVVIAQKRARLDEATEHLDALAEILGSS
ncbi:hypothetical protein [Pseudonocardia endophytica]|uniref:Uncharacterized protein n=1 Tax=Pseudonocardia endophytica TaxID=401976 RepID=A0A4R1HGS3_PSEEN|nr:hypothetical protein [Pseudonocardia endophytica]TCK21367.1 hypothetical protein EV378_5349 [Pseudonocardia endophytica]